MTDSRHLGTLFRLLTCVAAAAATFAFESCNGGSSGKCNATCPLGCDVSEDCQTCVPESEQAGIGSACNGDNDCCVGTCVSSICTPSPGNGGGGTGGSSGSGGTSAGGGTSTGGTVAGCKPWSGTPSPSYDAACNPGGGSSEVCSPTGTCIPNCNASPGYCGTGAAVCAVNGHCETPGGSSTGTSRGSSTSAGSTGTSRGGSSSGSTGTVIVSSGGVASGGFGSSGLGSGGLGSGGFGSGGFGSGGLGSGGLGSGGLGSGGFSSGGGNGGFCGSVGASCSRATETTDCCSEYCVSSACACNKGGGLYPCQTASDCCAGATCSNGVCQ